MATESLNQKRSKDKRVKILAPILEEEQGNLKKCDENKTYKKIFKMVHKDLKKMNSPIIVISTQLLERVISQTL